LCLNFSFDATAPLWVKASSFTKFLDHTQRRITVGRTPLDEWSARRRDLYLTTHNTHDRLFVTLHFSNMLVRTTFSSLLHRGHIASSGTPSLHLSSHNLNLNHAN
jgi:hypothetical protein